MHWSFTLHALLFLLLNSALTAGALAQGSSDTVFTIPVRVHILTSIDVDVNGKQLATWVTQADFTTSVLPEMNRIWKPAGVQWKIESIVVEDAVKGPELQALLQRVAAKEKVEFPAFKAVFPAASKQPGLVHLYLLPVIGALNGVAGINGNVAIAATWRRKGPNDFQRAPLVTSSPMLVSVAKTSAHEVGHNLGLGHPDEKIVERLMQAGPGTLLIPEEITTARKRAAILAK